MPNQKQDLFVPNPWDAVLTWEEIQANAALHAGDVEVKSKESQIVLINRDIIFRVSSKSFRKELEKPSAIGKNYIIDTPYPLETIFLAAWLLSYGRGFSIRKNGETVEEEIDAVNKCLSTLTIKPRRAKAVAVSDIANLNAYRNFTLSYRSSGESPIVQKTLWDLGKEKPCQLLLVKEPFTVNLKAKSEHCFCELCADPPVRIYYLKDLQEHMETVHGIK